MQNEVVTWRKFFRWEVSRLWFADELLAMQPAKRADYLKGAWWKDALKTGRYGKRTSAQRKAFADAVHERFVRHIEQLKDVLQGETISPPWLHKRLKGEITRWGLTMRSVFVAGVLDGPGA
jgi:hypothetical protein